MAQINETVDRHLSKPFADRGRAPRPRDGARSVKGNIPNFASTHTIKLWHFVSLNKYTIITNSHRILDKTLL
jgi:hypothetical protein